MADEASPHDVIVVGARPAGAATAMLLARAGLSVALLDRDRQGTDTLSTHALMRGAVMLLQRWGLLDQIAASTPPVPVTTFFYPDHDVPVRIKPAFGVSALYAPRRTVLDPVLVESARASGVDVRFRASVVGLVRDGGRVAGVEVHDPRRRSQVLRSRLVIGADGRRSTIARLVGARTTHLVEHTSAVVYGYFADLPAAGYEWAYRPGFTAGAIPTNDRLTCAFAGNHPDRIGRGGTAVLHALATACNPALGERLRAARPASPVRTFTGQPGHLRQAWGPGWALVGDAGSWKDPITAHGLTDALRDAALLATAATSVLRGEQQEASAYGAYERTRDRLSLPMLRQGDEIAALRWDQVRIVEILMELNAAMNDELEVIDALGSTVDRAPDPTPA